MKPRLQVDLDGTLHAFTSGWLGNEAMPDAPVQGAIEWLQAVVVDGRFDVVIFTARISDCTDDVRARAITSIRAWLKRHGAGDLSETIEITNVKRGAWLTIDDRGWRFAGRFPTPDEIVAIRPWNDDEARPDAAGAILPW